MKNLPKQKGFTLVESLVAIGILVTVITGVMTAVSTSLSSQTFSKEQVIAFYLAQEAMEQIRNLKDKNKINGVDWLTGISQNAGDTCYFGKACIVNPLDATFQECAGGPGNCPKLRHDSETGFYGYNAAWPEINFTREIILEEITSGREIAILVKVYWSKGSINKEFRVRNNLFNW